MLHWKLFLIVDFRCRNTREYENSCVLFVSDAEYDEKWKCASQATRGKLFLLPIILMDPFMTYHTTYIISYFYSVVTWSSIQHFIMQSSLQRVNSSMLAATIAGRVHILCHQGKTWWIYMLLILSWYCASIPLFWEVEDNQI